MSDAATRFAELWATLTPIGLGPDGGYLRHPWSDAELTCRQWFREQATVRGLTVDADGNGNLFAWWGDPATGGAVLTGSHFDSVPHGGAYDGPLGVVSGLLALDVLRERGVQPTRPVGVAAFVAEEGSRFGLACLGSRLLTGAVHPDVAADLRDRDGHTLAEVIAATGGDPSTLGADPVRVSQLAAFVELHIEQGRALTAPVGVATAIWPHGRWRLDFTGQANHAGTTRMADRHDPMLTFADTVLAAADEARSRGVHATVGRVAVAPNATNAIAATVTGWLDARAPSTSELDDLVGAVLARANQRARHDGTEVAVTAESTSPVTEFDAALRERLRDRLDGAPLLPTGAGHDAGILATRVPTAMLFVRNPDGVSHAPGERATDSDCGAGVLALADVLTDLSTGPA